MFSPFVVSCVRILSLIHKQSTKEETCLSIGTVQGKLALNLMLMK